MDKDLFGNKIVKSRKKTRLESSLLKYDKDSFNDRFLRLRYIKKIFPKNCLIAGRMDTVFTFDEAKMAFINGEFISTVLLAQAFIEKKLQGHYEHIGLEKIAHRGLKSILRHAKQNGILQDYLLNKIDDLRKIRNPFTHLKPVDYEYNFHNRFMLGISNSKESKYPSSILEKDAKEALSLIYTVFIADLGTINN